MDNQNPSPKKHKTRSQRKRIAIRRQRRKDGIKEAATKLIWEQQLAKFLEEHSEPELSKLHIKTYYEKVDNKRRRVTLYTRGYSVYAHYDNHFDVIYVTPDGQKAFLPDTDEPTASIKKILEFARQFGVNEFPIHPKYHSPEPPLKPRLIKASRD